MSELRLAALILAAGESSRFGGCKHLAEIDGVPMLQLAVNRVRDLVTETCAVTGAWHDEIAAALAAGTLSGVKLIQNTQWQRGLGFSLAVGIRELEEKFDGVLVLLADQVAITPEDVQTLLSQFDGKNIVCGFYGERRGVPAIFGAPHFELLKNLDGDKGARSLLNHYALPIVECSMPRAALDIDTRQELEHWLERERTSV